MIHVIKPELRSIEINISSLASDFVINKAIFFAILIVQAPIILSPE